jgi:steroid delta-isomerase-like uncharacterized protein
MAAEANAELARRVYQAFNQGDLEAAVALADEGIEVTFVAFDQTFRGKSGFREFLEGFRTAFPDLNIRLVNQVASEDQVANEFSWRGTHAGPLLTPMGQIDPSGRTVECRACEIWQIRNGRLASIRNYQDTASLMQQIGLMPEE